MVIFLGTKIRRENIADFYTTHCGILVTMGTCYVMILVTMGTCYVMILVTMGTCYVMSPSF